MKITDKGITVDAAVLTRAFNPITRTIDFETVFESITVNGNIADETVVIEGGASSAIEFAVYDAGTKSLVVKFRESGMYRYEGISLTLAFRFAQAESKGAFFHREIKNRFIATRV